MALTERLAIFITADGRGATREFEKVGRVADRELGKATNRIDKVGATLTSVGTKMLVGGGLIAAGLYKATEAANVQEQAELKLQNTINNMPKLAGASAQGMFDYASGLQKVTVAGDEQIISAMSLLGTFNLTEQQIKDITPLVIDYARKFDVDLNDAAIAVGKTLDGQVSALRRQGVTIDENAYKTDRFAAVQDALAKQVGGFAEEEAKTFTGQLQQMKNTLGDVSEQVGVGAAGAFRTILGPLKSAAEGFGNLDEGTQQWLGTAAGFASIGLIGAGALSTITGWLIKMRTNLSAGVDGLKSFGRMLKGNVTVTSAAATGIAGLTAVLITAKAALDEAASAGKQAGTDLGDMFSASSVSSADQFRARAASLRDEMSTLNQELDDMGSLWNMSWGDHTKFTSMEAYRDELQKIAAENIAVEAATAAVSNATGESSDKVLEWVLQAKEAGARMGDINQLLDYWNNGIPAAIDGTGGLADAQTVLADETGDAADALEEQEKRLKDARAAMDEYWGVAMSGIDAEVAVKDAFASITQAALENGATLDINTEAGRKNIGMLTDAGGAIQEWARSQLDAGAAPDEVRDGVNLQVLALKEQYKRLNFSDDAVNDLITRMGLMPTQVTTQFSTPGLAQANIDMDALLGRLNTARNMIMDVINNQIVTTTTGGPGNSAVGTRIMPNDFHVVGEHGPEIVYTGSKGANVMTASQTRAATSVIHEDSPNWDPFTMGNGRAGPGYYRSYYERFGRESPFGPGANGAWRHMPQWGGTSAARAPRSGGRVQPRHQPRYTEAEKRQLGEFLRAISGGGSGGRLNLGSGQWEGGKGLTVQVNVDGRKAAEAVYPHLRVMERAVART